MWRHTGSASWGDRCTLTVVPDDNCRLLGVVVVQPLEMEMAMNRREGDYCRVPLVSANIDLIDTGSDLNRQDQIPNVYLYVGHKRHQRPGDQDFPVYLSYVDTVLQGYRQRHGEAGAHHFLQSTSDWHVPIVNDRDAPRYPRHTPLTGSDRRFIDALLAAHDISITSKF